MFPCVFLCLGFQFGSTTTPSGIKPGATGGLTFGETPSTTGGFTLGATPTSQPVGFSFGTKSSSSFQFGTPTATAATTQQPGGFALNSSSTTGISFGTPATSSGQAASGRFRLGGAGKLFSWKVGV